MKHYCQTFFMIAKLYVQDCDNSFENLRFLIFIGEIIIYRTVYTKNDVQFKYYWIFIHTAFYIFESLVREGEHIFI